MCLLSFLKWGSIGYSLGIVQWDFTRQDHRGILGGYPGRVLLAIQQFASEGSPIHLLNLGSKFSRTKSFCFENCDFTRIWLRHV